MTEQVCPKCDTRFTTRGDWAKAAVSTLMVAPAVRDMATQVRCPNCHHLFADSEVSHLRATRFSSAALLWLVVIGIAGWGLYRIFFS